MRSSAAAVTHKKGHILYIQDALDASPAHFKIWKEVLLQVQLHVFRNRTHNKLQYTHLTHACTCMLCFYLKSYSACHTVFFWVICCDLWGIFANECLLKERSPSDWQKYRQTESHRLLKQLKAMLPLFLASLGTDTEQTDPCDYILGDSVCVCLHVQMSVACVRLCFGCARPWRCWYFFMCVVERERVTLC